MSDLEKIFDAVDIVREWLKEHGYGGLCYPGECGCQIDDLAPCGEDFRECQAAYLILRKDFTETEKEAWPDEEWIMTCKKRYGKSPALSALEDIKKASLASNPLRRDN